MTEAEKVYYQNYLFNMKAKGSIENIIVTQPTIQNIVFEPARISDISVTSSFNKIAIRLDDLDVLQKRLEMETRKHKWKKIFKTIKQRRVHK